MNFSKIKMMFFDFDDTLLIHYREQRLDSTGEAHRERLLRRQVETKDGYRVFDERAHQAVSCGASRCPEILHLFRAGQHHSAVQKTLVGDALPKPVLRYDWHFQS